MAADEYQDDDDRLLTRREAREHRREVAGIRDEVAAMWSAIKNAVGIVNRIEIIDGESITFRTKKE